MQRSADASVSPARIAFDEHGTPHAADYDDIYHAAEGGPAQARHVFIGGNRLLDRWRTRRRFAILETGFGLGLNFLCTARAYLDDPNAPQRLHYVAVEKHPACEGDLERAHAHWPEVADLAAALRHEWPPALRGFHRIEFAGGRIVLTLLFGDAASMLGELDPALIDAVYLDGFAPQKNPHMWSADIFRQIERLSRPGTTAATWSVAAIVRAGLRSAGFVVERAAGFGRKREMLTAHRRGEEAGGDPQDRRAVVIGAGLAGCWAAHALVRRGWTVDLVERHCGPAREASGNPVGALLPALNLADNENARLARAAFLHASRVLGAMGASPNLFERCGLLHLALERGGAALALAGAASKRRSRQAQRERMQTILARHRFPADYVSWIETGEASRRTGMTVGSDGWWIPAGGWVRPRVLCDALIEEAAPGLRSHYGTEARRLQRVGSVWRVVDTRNDVVAEAPVAIVANAHAAATLGLEGLPRLIAVRGQISCLPPREEVRLGCVVCGDGYAAPLPDGGLCVGATFEPGSEALDLRAEDHAENVRRAHRMLPGLSGIAHDDLRGRVGLRTATADRLPACGPLPPRAAADSRESHLLLLAGLGARGLVWSPLCAEILASRLDHEPNPVEASLIAAMDPARDAGNR